MAVSKSPDQLWCSRVQCVGTHDAVNGLSSESMCVHAAPTRPSATTHSLTHSLTHPLIDRVCFPQLVSQPLAAVCTSICLCIALMAAAFIIVQVMHAG